MVERKQHEERQENRRIRYKTLAKKARQEAEAKTKTASAMLRCIPAGQPILIGHHSEGRDRRFRARIAAITHQAYAIEKKAEYYEQKAERVGKGGISSDDPQAIEKLTAQLEALEAASAKMKAANKAIRKNDRDGLVELGFSEKEIEVLFKGDPLGRKGYAAFELTTNRTTARRIQERIKTLEKTRARDHVEQEGAGYTYREDPVENRIMFEFDGKPDVEIRQVLKSHAFKWAPSRGAWVRHLNNAGLYAAKCVRKKLDGMTE